MLGLLLYAVDTAVAGFGAVTAVATATFAAGSYWFYDSDVIAVDPWLVGLNTLTALVFFVIVMTVVLRAQAGRAVAYKAPVLVSFSQDPRPLAR